MSGMSRHARVRDNVVLLYVGPGLDVSTVSTHEVL